MPKENIIFLDKDDEGKRKVIESEDKKQTFAANIHTLFSDGFFMESTTGAFAKEKISEILKKIDCYSKDKFLEEKDKIEGIINLIGEPILKRKLKEMFNEKLNSFTEITNLKLELEKTKQELELLKNRYEITIKK